MGETKGADVTDKEILEAAIEEAQGVLAGYVEPGQRDCERAINRLLAILDIKDLLAAVKLSDRQKAMEDSHGK